VSAPGYEGLWYSDLAAPVVEIGVGTTDAALDNPVGLWDDALWDSAGTGAWAGIEPDWVTVEPCSLLDIETSRGRSRWTEPFDAGSASITVDTRLSALEWGDQVVPSQLTIRPGRQLRITALHQASGITYPIFRGWIESIVETFQPDASPTVVVNAQDALAQISHVTLPSLIAPVGDGELSGARINRILDNAEWPTMWRNTDAGLAPMQGTYFASGTLLDEAKLTSDSEGGGFYADPDGIVRFRDRNWLRDAPEAKTVQGIIGAGSGEYCAAEYVPARDGADVVNDVQVNEQGGDLQRLTDSASIANYRRRVFQKTDYICTNPSDVTRLGQRMLSSRKTARARIPSVSLTPVDSDTFAFVLGVRFGYRLEIKYEPGTAAMYDTGEPWTETVLVQGIAHHITTTDWTCDLTVDDASAFPQEGWDHNAGWDVSLWAEAV
jgi:hypothetical protein